MWGSASPNEHASHCRLSMLVHDMGIVQRTVTLVRVTQIAGWHDVLYVITATIGESNDVIA
jgi:hypothetical protein